MVITICSLFRDSASYLETRYFPQITNNLGNLSKLRFVFVEGDSTDGTYDCLKKWSSGPYSHSVKIIKHDQHTPKFGSIVDRNRFRALAELGNLALTSVFSDSDYVLWLESDLIIPAGLIGKLKPTPGVTKAPFVIRKSDGYFYDTWGFRKDGRLFSHKIKPGENEFSVDSAGSVLLIPYDYIKSGARFTEEEAIVGLCKNLTGMGCEIRVVPTVEVYHP